MKKPVFYKISKDPRSNYKYKVQVALKEELLSSAWRLFEEMNYTNYLWWARYVQVPRLARRLRKIDDHYSNPKEWSGVV